MVIGPATSGAFYSVQLETSGQIVAAGSGGGKFLVERFNSDGSIDNAFGSAGIATASLGANAIAYSVALDASNDIVVAGTGGNQFALARFTPAGTLDPIFNSNGILTFNIGTNDVLGKVLVQPDGKIVAVGGSGSSSVIVARFNGNGTFDSTFGGDPAAGMQTVSGFVPTDITPGVPDQSEGLALQSDGKFVVVGQSPDNVFAVARFTSSGQPDQTFSADGVVTTSINGQDDADAVSIDPATGELLVVGTTASGGTPLTAVAQYTTDGNLDTGFGQNGILTLPTGVGPSGRAYYLGSFFVNTFIAQQPDGRQLVGTSGGPGMTSTIRRFGTKEGNAIPNNSVLQPTVSGRLPTTKLVAGGKVAPITQTIKVINTSSAPISGTITINLLLSPDTAGSTADPSVAMVSRKVSIKPGKFVLVPVVVRSLPAGVSGTRHLLAVLTDPNAGSGVGASAGTVSIQPPFIDLSGSLGRPPTVKSGRSGLVSLTLMNSGNVAATGLLPIDVLASADGMLDASSIDLGTISKRINIPAGRKIALPLLVPFSSVAPGSYVLIARLDPTNTLGDANPANNTVFGTLPVTVK
jgi:uncharacterized delta-60 repeat protein